MAKQTIGSDKWARGIKNLYDKTGGHLMEKTAKSKVRSVPFLKVR